MEMGSSLARDKKLSVSKRSGATYSSLYVPSRAFLILSRTSEESSVLLISAAAIPMLTSASTWSFIKEINGEMTIVTPSNKRAGT